MLRNSQFNANILYSEYTSNSIHFSPYCTFVELIIKYIHILYDITVIILPILLNISSTHFLLCFCLIIIYTYDQNKYLMGRNLG